MYWLKFHAEEVLGLHYIMYYIMYEETQCARKLWNWNYYVQYENEIFYTILFLTLNVIWCIVSFNKKYEIQKKLSSHMDIFL